MRSFSVPSIRTARAAAFVLALASLLCGSLFAAAQTAPPDAALWQQLTDKVAALAGDNKLQEAIAPAQQAVQVAEQVFGPAAEKTGESLSDLGMLYSQTGRNADAIPLLERALNVQTAALGPNAYVLANTLKELGDAYMLAARFFDAAHAYESEGKLCATKSGAESQEYAHTLVDFAHALGQLTMYSEEAAVLQTALGIYQKLYDAAGGNPSQELKQQFAILINNDALLYIQLGQYSTAEPMMKQAVQAATEAFGEFNAVTAKAVRNLGLLYVYEGRYADAENAITFSGAIEIKLNGADSSPSADSLEALAILYDAEGLPDKAGALNLKVLAEDEKTYGVDSPKLVRVLSNLASEYMQQAANIHAKQFLERAVAICKQSEDGCADTFAGLLNDLGRLYFETGDLTKASNSFQDALKLTRIDTLASSTETAQLQANLGMVYLSQGLPAKAEPLLRNALAALQKAIGPDHSDTAEAEFELAGTLTLENKPNDAEPFFEQGLLAREHERQQAFTYMGEQDRLTFLQPLNADLDQYYSYAKRFAAAHPEYAGRMYDLLLDYRGIVASSMNALRAQVEASGDTQSLDLLNQIVALKAELEKASRAGITSYTDPAYKQQVGLQIQVADIEGQLAQRSSHFARMQHATQNVSWSSVQKALQPGDAAVEFVRWSEYDGAKFTGREFYAALVLTPELSSPRLIQLGDAAALEGRPMQEYRAGIAQPDVNNTPPPSLALYNAVWKPLEPALGKASRIYIATAGVLSQIALGSIPAPGGKLMMDNYDLRFVNSTRDLLDMPAASTAKTAMLVGNPLFTMTPNQHTVAVAAWKKTQAAHAAQPAQVVNPAAVAAILTDKSRQTPSAGCPASELVCPLPGTGKEVEALYAQLTQAQWTVAAPYEQQQALEEVVKSAPHPRLLVLATHGTFKEDAPPKNPHDSVVSTDPMLRSGMLFADVSRVLRSQPPIAGLDDGMLTAMEASAMDLDGTELVVLSACETGLGEVHAGEGVFGLRRAFAEAGAQTVMMSMWKVPDETTHQLMAAFFSNWLGGMEKHAALSAAQQTIRSQPGHESPFYWGAFVLVGH